MEDIHKQFTEYGKNAKKWLNKCKMLLLEIDEKRIWRKKKFFSIYDYAARIAGMSESVVSNSLWILKSIKDKPYLRKIAEEKGLSSLAPIISVATCETDKFWAEKVKIMSNETLRAYVRGITQQGNSNENPETKSPPLQNTQKSSLFLDTQTSENISVHDASPDQPTGQNNLLLLTLDSAILLRLQKAKGNKSWEQIITELLEAQKAQLESEKPEPVKSESRHIPAKIEKYVLKRSNGFCEIADCSKPHEELHHTDRFAISKTHDPDKIVALCSAHHKLAHHSLYKNENGPPEKWTVRTNPDNATTRYKIDSQVQKYRSVAIRAP